MAADFRLSKASDYYKWYNIKHKAVKNIRKSIYSIPELVGNKIKNYKIISCPGCYPTSILIPLVPLIRIIGNSGTNLSGSIVKPSSSR